MRIYYASLSSDPPPYRKTVQNAVRAANIDWIAKDDLDLGQSARRLSREIQKSDAVVLVIGHRLGPLMQEEEGASWLELVYSRTLESGRPCVVFFATASAQGFADPSSVDVANLRRFQQEVERTSVFATFRNPSELAAEVLSALRRIEQSPQLSPERHSPLPSWTPGLLSIFMMGIFAILSFWAIWSLIGSGWEISSFLVALLDQTVGGNTRLVVTALVFLIIALVVLALLSLGSSIQTFGPGPFDGVTRRLRDLVRNLNRKKPPKPLSGTIGAESPSEAVTEVIRVFFATDRQKSERPEPRRFFDNERAQLGELSLGVCFVSIPNSERHKIGGLEKPSIFKVEFSEDPRKHVILTSVETRNETEFFTELRDRVGRSERNEAFVFIHGYNVTFEDATRRAAQFACDLRFDGAPILYSWPSRGRWWQYAADETNVSWSVPHLEYFLNAIASASGARTVHLIAHSMGNRVLTSALELLVAKKAVSTELFRHIVLTAPDIDSDTFHHLAAAISPVAGRLTLYSNYKDRALLLSKLFHLYRRAGATIVFVKGMDTIDASKVDTSLTRHSYFGGSRTVLADLSSLLLDGKPPKKRFGMRERQTTKGTYYVFRP